jgi:hypothetical protein
MTAVEYGSLREKIAAETKARKARYAEFEAAYAKAAAAAKAAGEAAKPRAMVVFDADLAGKPVEGGNRWYEAEGVCGFAWVTVAPGTSSFAKWLVKNKLARAAYRGGVDIWISAFGQSLERKEAAARAMAEVLRTELGVNAYAGSRMD